MIAYPETKRPVGQGDLLIRRVDKLEKNIKPVMPKNGQYILAHSETGAHHIVDATPRVEVFDAIDDELCSYLVVSENIDTEVVLYHTKDVDGHESYSLSPGIYKIRRQIESSPEGFRRALD